MTSSRRFARTFFGVSLLGGLFAFALAGCEEDATGVLGLDQPFTLYGVLNPKSDTQWVRVFPIEDRLTPRGNEPLDAAVRSTDLTSGEARVWQDSVIQEPNGLYEHVFWSLFRADYGHTYRLEVERSDAALSSAEAEVPTEARLLLEEPTAVRPVSQVVFVAGDVPRLMKVEVEYYLKAITSSSGETVALAQIVLPYTEQTRRTEGGWDISINLSSAHQTLLQQLRSAYVAAPSFGIKVLQMEMRLIVASEAWAPPGGVFDPNVLVQPGTLDNVENGFGFIGAGYRLQKIWKPSDEALEAAGFAQQADTVIVRG